MSDTAAQLAELYSLIQNLEDEFSAVGEVGPPGAIITEKGEAKPLGGGLAWEGPWNREEGYEEHALVRWNGHLYVCYEPIEPAKQALGVGPFSQYLHSAIDLTTPIRVPPIARLSKLEEVAGILENSQPVYLGEIGDNEPGQGLMHGVMFEFWMSNPGGILSMKATPNHKRKVGPYLQATVFNDKPNFAGENGAAKGWEPEHEAFEIGGGGGLSYGEEGPEKRFYIFVNGAIFEPEGEHHPKIESENPCPFTFEIDGESTKILEGPGNKPPSEDVQHWERVL